MRFAVALYGLALVLAVATMASAQAEQRQTATLAYTRAPGAEACPDEQELRDAVSGRLGYVPFQAEAERRIDVRFGKSGTKLIATLRVARPDAPPKTRTLESEAGDCIELAQAVALALSVAIDPLGATRPAEPDPEPAPETREPEPVPAPAPTAEPPAPTARPAEPRPSPPIARDRGPTEPEDLRLSLAAIGRTAWGELPKLSPGVGLGVGVRRGPLSAAIWLDMALPVSDATSRGGYDASLFGATLRGCWHPQSVFVCALGRGARVEAEGRDVDRPKSDAGLIAAAGAGVGFELQVARSLSLAAGIDGLFYVSRLALDLDGRELWSQPPAGAAGWLALSTP